MEVGLQNYTNKTGGAEKAGSHRRSVIGVGKAKITGFGIIEDQVAFLDHEIRNAFDKGVVRISLESRHDRP